MATWKEMAYLVLDELKLTSDDDLFNEEHVIFLLKKYRALVLKQEYERKKKELEDSLDDTLYANEDYTDLCLDLEQVAAINGELCEGGTYLRSTKKIPSTIAGTTPIVYTEDYFQSQITFVSKNRFKYVGNNKWLLNFIYATIGPDDYLYLKSQNPQYLYLEKIKVSVVLEDPEEAEDLLCCNEDDSCDFLNTTFSLRDYLIPQVIQYVVKELSGVEYRPRDFQNNAADNLSQNYIPNSKSEKANE